MSRHANHEAQDQESPNRKSRHPSWLRRSLPSARALAEIRSVTYGCGLATVCREARCPNQGECYAEHTATFLILGDTCTRNCAFCAVTHGVPVPLRSDEPEAVARAARNMGLSHVVVTSVTRDDLPDGGASVFAATIHAVRAAIDGATVEVLVPDFGGSIDALQQVVDAGPDVINHNLETVRRLYAAVRDRASYERSLELLDRCRNLNGNIITKSGIMVGLGETTEEILALIQDVAHTGCRAMTIGQYLRPTSRHRPVERFYTPDEFAELEQSARSIGIREVCAGPLVRSSYRAAAVLRRLKGEAGTGSQT